MEDTLAGVAKIAIGGAYRTGKSSRKARLVDQWPDIFEVGRKYKLREGGAWASDLVSPGRVLGNLVSGLWYTEPIDPVLRQIREEEFRESKALPSYLNKDSTFVTESQLQGL